MIYVHPEDLHPQLRNKQRNNIVAWMVVLSIGMLAVFGWYVGRNYEAQKELRWQQAVDACIAQNPEELFRDIYCAFKTPLDA